MKKFILTVLAILILVTYTPTFSQAKNAPPSVPYPHSDEKILAKIKNIEDEANYEQLVREFVSAYHHKFENPDEAVQKIVAGRRYGLLMSAATTEYILVDRCDIALKWLEELKKIDPEAYNVMTAKMLINGDCFPKDIHKAASLLKSGDSGDLKHTYVRLFLATANSPDCPIEKSSGFATAREIAECGYEQASGLLARMCFEGIGAPKNYEAAYVWYLIAVSQAKVEFERNHYQKKLEAVCNEAQLSEARASELRSVSLEMARIINNNSASSKYCSFTNAPSKTAGYFISDVPFQGAGSIDNVIKKLKQIECE